MRVTISIFYFISVFILPGCSEVENPVDQLIQSKVADEVFVIFGEPLFLSCLGTKKADKEKCNSEIVGAVAAAQKNGYGEVKPEHFTSEVKARLFAKLKASLEAGSKKNAQAGSPTPWD